MKTLADLKRDLQIGTKLTMTHGIRNKLVGIPRYVVTKQGNGVSLSEDPKATRGSFLELPRASLVEYDGKTIRVYTTGSRPLTAEEQRILDNEPSKRPENAEHVKMDMMADMNWCYWHDKTYHKENGTEYLSGHETIRGLRYNFNDKTVYDETLKGELSLEYTIG